MTRVGTAKNIVLLSYITFYILGYVLFNDIVSQLHYLFTQIIFNVKHNSNERKIKWDAVNNQDKQTYADALDNICNEISLCQLKHQDA